MLPIRHPPSSPRNEDAPMPRRILRTALAAGLGLATAAAVASAVQPAQAAATSFKVLAFYDTDSGDAAHNDYVKEALPWFAQTGSQNGFSFESTTDWGR